MLFGRLSSGGLQPIAIEFGVGALKALQVTTSDPPQLVAAAMIETPDELRGDHSKRFDFQAQALPKLLKAAAFKGKRAMCSLPASQTHVQHMQVQKNDAVGLAGVVAAQLQAQMNCNPNGIVVRPIEVADVQRGGATRTEVICIAAAKEIVLRQVRALQACKLDTVGVHAEHVAIVRAFDHLTRRVEDEKLVSLYVDLGAGSTKVAITHGKQIVFAKSIQIGGRTLDLTVAAHARLTPAEGRQKRLTMTALTPEPARESAPASTPVDDPGLAAMTAAIRKEGTGGTTVVTPAPAATRVVAAAPVAYEHPEPDLSEPLESLTDEIAMCLRYHASLFPGRKVERAIFVGGESRQIALCQHVARVLRLPARVADPLAQVARTGGEPSVGVDLGTPQPGWAVAYGLSLCPADL